MSLEAIVYVSTCSRPPSQADLEQLLVSARERNIEYAVTGALVYHDHSFIQYFEGPRAGIAVVYEHVRRSSLHHGMIELLRRPIEAREFPDWSMGFTMATESPLLEAASTHFLARARTPSGFQTSDGRELVMQFWSNVRHGVR